MLKHPNHRRPTRSDLKDVLTGARRINLKWRELEVDYAWLPPFHGVAPTRPNRIEVVFSEHQGVAVEHCGKVYDITVQQGGTYAVGPDGTRLLQVPQYSDTLEMYPSADLLVAAGAEIGSRELVIEPTLQGSQPKLFTRDAIFLAHAHLLRQVCMGQLAVTDIAISTLAHQLVWHIVFTQRGNSRHRDARYHTLGQASLSRVCEFIESRLGNGLSLDELASCANLSPWHFARQFKASTGLAPHQYVLCRRMELAKQLLLTTDRSVQDIAWDIGFENHRHFRRQFRKYVGAMPGQLRVAIRAAVMTASDRFEREAGTATASFAT